MSQTWKINGQTYNHGQLMELKRQGLDPRRDKIILKSVTNQPAEVVEEKVESTTEVENITEDAVDEQPETAVEEVSNDQGALPEGENVEGGSLDNAPGNATDEATDSETEEEEFARLKTERAWVNPDKKARYDELKAKFNT